MRPQTIVERLDFVAKRIPGLKFTPPTQLKPGDDQGYGCFMSCDMYYIEIKVDQSHQSVKDVVISHGNNADGISCPVLRKVLGDQDFETFAKHLSGLHSIYQISTNDKKVKQRAYPALTALETDLTTLYDHQRRRTNNCHDLVHKSPIGIMEPRKGGLPVKLTYFITPYDLVDTTHKGLINLTINNIIDKNLGLSATVEIEGSGTHKLQIKSLISNQHNSSLPAYAPFNSQNSEKLPAQFVLKLSQPFPMLSTSINQIINEINEPSTIKEYLTNITTSSKESLISLIARQELDLNKGPYYRTVDTFKGGDSDSCDLRKHVYSIKLLDEYHTYHILDNYLEQQDGVYVTKIPFTHPTSIPNILRVLRQQALFNFLIGSCIRPNKINNNNAFDQNITRANSESNIFDIIPVNLNNICISFEHPSKESLATLEIDFKELSCQLYALDRESVCSNEFATKVLQKCWSIPITLRSVLKKCNERRLALLEDATKRRERELQELLANNSAQQNLQYKPQIQYQEALLQSKFNSLNEKSNPRDLNSIAEFLTAKINSASTSDASNQTNVNSDCASNRSNLLKKFSCKPKAKQNTATKNQTGNKILSLMLKRQNSTTSSSDDANLKATLAKKVKTKNQQGESSVKSTGGGVTTTKVLTGSEVPTTVRLVNKQSKQNASTMNVSLSLIRSPNKSQPSNISSSSTSSIPTGVSANTQGLPSGGSKQFESGASLSSSGVNPINHVRAKSQNGNNNAVKPRKSSIGAVLDRLVGGVTPEQNSTTNSSEANSEFANKNLDPSKGSPLGAKSKSRIPTDQFAIKQGSVGSLKLTVTKTKPATVSSASTSSSTSTSATTLSSTFSTSGNNNLSSSKSETNKILALGSSTPNIKYTIPKISKTQQSSQSGSNQANPTDNQNSTSNDSSSQGDDSSNPSSSANSSSAPFSATNKRSTSIPFNRTNNSNRNPVSSSTHPLGRTTSNPLALASRPSSTSTTDNHILNRISSSNPIQQNMRQQMNNRMVNLQQQSVQRPTLNQSTIGSGIGSQQQQHSNQQPTQPPMFALGLNQQVPFQNASDINLIAANQAALLNQQRNQNLNQLQQIAAPFMSSSADANLISSSRPQFPASMPQQQPISIVPSSNSLGPNVCDSIQRPSPSVINAPPQFYIRQPMFDDTSNTVSSTPRVTNEASQSSPFPDRKTIDSAPAPPPTASVPISYHPRTNESRETSGEMSSSTLSTGQAISGVGGNQGVSSSSDSGGNQDLGPTISTPSSPTECGHAGTVPPPPLIPIDSLEEPQATSPETDHPDDASDRLSIVDTNENIADSISAAGTPKPSSVNSPLNTQDSNSATPSSSSRIPDSANFITSVNNGSTPTESAAPSIAVTTQSPTASTSSDGSASAVPQSSSVNDESNGISRQALGALATTDEPITPQSTMATTSEMI